MSDFSQLGTGSPFRLPCGQKFCMYSSMDEVIAEIDRGGIPRSEEHKEKDRAKLSKYQWGAETCIFATTCHVSHWLELLGVGLSMKSEDHKVLAFTFHIDRRYIDFEGELVDPADSHFDAAHLGNVLRRDIQRCTIVDASVTPKFVNNISWMVESCFSKAYHIDGRLSVLKRCADLDSSQNLGSWVLTKSAAALSRELSCQGLKLDHEIHSPRLQVSEAHYWCHKPTSLQHIVNTDRPGYVLTIAMISEHPTYQAVAELWHVESPFNYSDALRSGAMSPSQSVHHGSDLMTELGFVISSVEGIDEDVVRDFITMPHSMSKCIQKHEADISERNQAISKLLCFEDPFSAPDQDKKAEESNWTVGTPLGVPSVFDI